MLAKPAGIDAALRRLTAQAKQMTGQNTDIVLRRR
jgi:hypothetical protein